MSNQNWRALFRLASLMPKRLLALGSSALDLHHSASSIWHCLKEDSLSWQMKLMMILGWKSKISKLSGQWPEFLSVIPVSSLQILISLLVLWLLLKCPWVWFSSFKHLVISACSRMLTLFGNYNCNITRCTNSPLGPVIM